jgi:glycosyltransferase involved in cell wall biosynthesis
MEKISVYIPCYNGDKFIGQCIEHLLKQTYPIDEILVVNDGSTDRTVEIASQYPVQIINHNVNKGLAAARNTGILNARNEFVASIDADCLASETWIQELVNCMTDTKIAGVGGKLIEKHQELATDRWRAVHMRQHWWDEKQYNPMFLFGHSNMFHKNVIEQVGMYNPKYRTNYEDVDISNRIRKYGYDMMYTPNAVVYHLRRDSVNSLLRAYWRWTLFDKVEPISLRTLLVKCRFNAGKTKYFILEDIKSHKFDLLLLDLLLLFYHNYFDWQYFHFNKRRR